MRIEGAGFTTSLIDGLFNSGSITGAAGGDDKQLSVMEVTAVSIGAGADIPVLFNSNENSGAPGNISASYTGTLKGGAAYAIHIEDGATVSSIINQGTIIASGNQYGHDDCRHRNSAVRIRQPERVRDLG